MYLLSSFFEYIPIAQAGFDRFTVIDGFGKWRIEQKFDSETKQIFCRASLNGNGTWFAEKVRLNRKNELVIPEGVSVADEPNLNEVRKIRDLLEKCRKGLLYLSK